MQVRVCVSAGVVQEPGPNLVNVELSLVRGPMEGSVDNTRSTACRPLNISLVHRQRVVCAWRAELLVQYLSSIWAEAEQAIFAGAIRTNKIQP